MSSNSRSFLFQKLHNIHKAHNSTGADWKAKHPTVYWNWQWKRQIIALQRSAIVRSTMNGENSLNESESWVTLILFHSLTAEKYRANEYISICSCNVLDAFVQDHGRRHVHHFHNSTARRQQPAFFPFFVHIKFKFHSRSTSRSFRFLSVGHHTAVYAPYACMHASSRRPTTTWQWCMRKVFRHREKMHFSSSHKNREPLPHIRGIHSIISGFFLFLSLFHHRVGSSSYNFSPHFSLAVLESETNASDRKQRTSNKHFHKKHNWHHVKEYINII